MKKLFWFIVIIIGMGDFFEVASNNKIYHDSYIKIIRIGSTIVGDSTENKILNVEGIPDPIAGIDVELDIWGISNVEEDLFIFVHDAYDKAWLKYGPATIKESKVIVQGVRLGEAYSLGKHLTIRAGIIDKNNKSKNNDPVQVCQILSNSIMVEMKTRFRDNISFSENTIKIVSVNGLVVDVYTPTLVNGIATIEGAIDSSVSKETNIYVLNYYCNSGNYKLFGPANRSMYTWKLPIVDFNDENRSEHCEIRMFAVVSNKKLEDVNVRSYKQLQKYIEAESGVIMISAAQRRNIIIDDFTKIDIMSVNTFNSEDNVSLEALSSVTGEVNKIPEGYSIWMAINPIGYKYWYCIDNPILSKEAGVIKWTYKISYNNEFKKNGSSHIRILAAVCPRNGNKQLMEGNDWMDKAIAISNEKVLPIKQKRHKYNKIITNPIANDNGAKLAINKLLESKNKLEIEGASKNIENVWVGISGKNSYNWQVFGPFKTVKNKWNCIIDKANEGNVDIVAFESYWQIPESIDQRDLNWYSSISSKVYSDASNRKGLNNLINPKKEWGMNVFLLVILCLGIIMLLAVIEYFSGASSEMFATVNKRLIVSNNDSYVKLNESTKSNKTLMTIGFIVLALLIVAIKTYLPIYIHVIQTVLDFEYEKAVSLASLLIIFTGITGMAIDLVSKAWSGLLRIFALTLLLLIAVFLLSVQSMLYYEMYKVSIVTDNPLLPIAMAGMGFFISAIEMLSFYFVTMTTTKALSSIFENIILLPIKVVIMLSSASEAFFRKIPKRNTATIMDN